MKYSNEMFWEDLRKVATSCISGLLIATFIYFFGPSGTRIQQDPTNKKTTVKNDNWYSLNDTYQIVSHDSAQPHIQLDNQEFAKVVPATPRSVYVQLNLPKSKSLSFSADRPYDLIKVGNVIGADTASVAYFPWSQGTMKVENEKNQPSS